MTPANLDAGVVLARADWSVPPFPLEGFALWQPTEVMRAVVAELEVNAEPEAEPEVDVAPAPEAEPAPTPTAAAEPKPEPDPTDATQPKPKPDPTAAAEPKPKPTPTAAPEPAAPAPLDQWGWAEPWVFEIPAARPTQRRRGTARRATRRRPRQTMIPLAVIVIAVAISVWIALPRSSRASAGQRTARTAAVSVLPHPSTYALSAIPGDYLRVYWRASTEYGLDWTKLAAVGQIESDQGRSATPGVVQGTNPAGAAGPAQFLGSTWARYGVDVDGRGALNPYDPADAITAMAAYLKASGAPEDWRAALFTYNHSTAYVNAVLALSRRYAGP